MKAYLKSTFYLILYIVAVLPGTAQNADKFDSIDGVLDALLAQISIEKGEKMDTATIRNLFHPNASFIVGDSSGSETASLDEFLVFLTDSYYEQGYLEREINRIVHEYNGIAQVFATFYGKHPEDGEERGINSYQLIYNQDRWWIANLLWTIESDKAPIPKKYGGKQKLPGKR